MVIEVVKWPTARKTHVLNQEWPHKTLCGAMLPREFEREEGWESFPTCKRCEIAVMRS